MALAIYLARFARANRRQRPNLIRLELTGLASDKSGQSSPIVDHESLTIDAMQKNYIALLL